jgi:hypothetical protein
MNLDDLKIEWRMEMQRAEPTIDFRFEGLKPQVAELRRGIRFGSFWMIFSCIGVSVIEVFVQFVSLDGAGWMSKLGAVAWVAFTIWLVAMLRSSVKTNRSDDWTLRSRLEIEIERVQRHRDTWSRVVAWYLAPMMCAVVLSGLGGSHDKTGSYAPGTMGWALLVTCVALFAFVYWRCRREIQTKLDPLLSRLKRLHADLIVSETGSL